MFSPVASVLFVCGGVTVGLGQVRSCLYALLGELYFPHCLGFFLGGGGGKQKLACPMLVYNEARVPSRH